MKILVDIPDEIIGSEKAKGVLSTGIVGAANAFSNDGAQYHVTFVTNPAWTKADPFKKLVTPMYLMIKYKYMI